MASTFSTNLAIELIGTGDQAGTWGVTTNTNLGTLIEQAISGYVTQAVSTGADTTITIPNGATGVARNMYIELTGTGGTNTNLIVPSNKKLYFIFNNTSSGQVTVKVSGQTGVSVPNGKKVVLVCNGTDIVNGLNYIADFGTNSFTVTNLTATSATITNLIATTASISDASATVLRSASATITNLLGTTLTISGNSFLATSSGNVGVGTASPVARLDVFKTSSDTISRTNAVGAFGDYVSLGAGLLLQQTLSSPYGFALQAANAANSVQFPLLLNPSGGNVGIGTASPAYKLDVSGSLRTTSFWALTGSPTGAGGSVRYIGGGGSSTNWYTNVPTGGSQFWAINESPVMALDSSGSLGIGTTSPAKKLDVRTSASGEAAVGTFSNDSTAAGTNVASLEFASSGVAKASIAAAVYGDGWMSFRNNDNTEKMRLDASGALLVGNTTKYNVGSAENNSVQVKGGIVLAANNTSSASNRNWIFQTNTAAAGSFSLAYSSTNTGWPNAAYALVVDSSGNLGIGTTSPSNKLTVQANDVFNQDSSGQIVIKGSSNTAKNLRIGFDTTSDYGYIQAIESGVSTRSLALQQFGGNVGIGTTSPTGKLSVSGYQTASGLDNVSATFSDALNSTIVITHAGSKASFGTDGAQALCFLTDKTERARITSGGNVGIGTTDPQEKLQVYFDSSSAKNGILVTNGNSTGSPAYIAFKGYDWVRSAIWHNRSADTGLVIAINPNTTDLTVNGCQERARWTQEGFFKASNTGTYASSTGAYHEVRSNQDGNTFVVGNTSTSTNTDGTIFIQNARNTTNNTYYIIGAYNTAAAAFKFRVADSGDVTNTNGTYGTISDAKMKTDIVDAGSQWNDLKAVRFRKFKMKNDPAGLMQLGVVAQELEQTSPGLVDEHTDRDAEGNDLGTTTKSVKTSVLLMKAAVALQEAMARIEKLEAEMAALKGA